MGIFPLTSYFNCNSAQNDHPKLIECSLEAEVRYTRCSKQFPKSFTFGAMWRNFYQVGIPPQIRLLIVTRLTIVTCVPKLANMGINAIFLVKMIFAVD